MPRALWTPSGTGATPRRPGPPGSGRGCARTRSPYPWHGWAPPGAPPSPRATIGGRAVFGGSLREINAGALVHYDEINREFPRGLFDQDVVTQLAFNVWVAVPADGGATTVWRHRWEPSDEEHRQAYGYAPVTVERCQQVSLTPRAGDALLFNPANFHAVQPNPTGRRIAFAFFLGLTTTGQLIAWS
jgi:hypothetical protein